MSSTYLTLCQRMKKECGIEGSENAPTSVLNQTGMLKKVVQWIADADEYILSQWLDWGFMLEEFSESTVAGTKDITAPSDLGSWDTESFYLNYTSDEYVHLYVRDYFIWRNGDRLGTQTNDEPEYVIIKPDKSLILHPPPDAVYTLTADYYKIATRMSADASTSPIPSRFDRLIIAQAKIYWATHEDAPEELQMAVAERDELMHRLESLYLPHSEARTLANSHSLRVIPE